MLTSDVMLYSLSYPTLPMDIWVRIDAIYAIPPISSASIPTLGAAQQGDHGLRVGTGAVPLLRGSRGGVQRCERGHGLKPAGQAGCGAPSQLEAISHLFRMKHMCFPCHVV